MAQARRSLGGLFLLASLSLIASGCAPAPRNAPERAPAIDAVLPAENAWRLFRLGAQRFALVPADSAAWAGEAWTRAEWRSFPSPGGAFRPAQAVQAARGYFLLVDAGGSRLCLYDSSAGLISTFPLPERFTPWPSGRAAVFRGVDGTFIFADYAGGEAWQYADREISQGAAAWVLRARVRMPVGWRDCYQPPGDAGLACRSANGALRFDGSLNRVVSTQSPAGARLSWDAGVGEWALLAHDHGGAPLFRFLPARRALVPP